MRIRSLEIEAFGRLRDLESGGAPLGPMVVIQGRNEAGKTSVFEFLCTLLYGIYPTTSDRHPFAPWDGAELGGVGHLTTRDGVDYEVTRRLRSAPVGTVRRNGRAEGIRNDDLPFLAHVPRSVFRQVYAVRLSELAGLDDDGWEAVQDRILGRLGAQDLRPAREVAAELETAARALWRPDRRGQPRIRQLDESIRQISARRPEARERAQSRRRAADRLDETRGVLRSAREERRRLQDRLDRLRRWVPVREELAAIASLHALADDVQGLDGLPPSPAGELARLRERVEAARLALHEVDADAESLRWEIEAFTDDDRALLDAAAEIDAFRGRVAAAEQLSARLAGIHQERRALSRRLADAAETLSWSGPVEPARLERLALPAVDTALARWSDAEREAYAGSSVSDGRSASTPETAVLAVAAVLMVLGVIGLLGGDLPGAPSTGLAWGLLLIGAVLLASVAGGRRRARELTARESARSEERSRAAREAREALAEQLAAGGLLPGEHADVDLTRRLREARQWLRDDRDLAGESEALEAKLLDLEAEADGLVELAPDQRGGTAAGLASVLHERLTAARSRATAAERAEERLVRVDAKRSEAEDRRAETSKELDALESGLARIDGDLGTAADIAERALAARREARERRIRLENRYAELGDIEESLDAAARAGEAWLSEPDPIGRLQDELERQGEAIEGWVAEEQALVARLEVPDGELGLDALEGELAHLREERDRLRKQHDRLAILSMIVDDADRHVRETHQPEILRLAGDHLALLTGGRYDRLEVADDRQRELHVSGPALDGPREVAEPLSTGTREQVYVALRLALARHLDQGGEPLPLFLDEIFVNWDPERRERGLDLLERAAEERQVFVFTCHPEWADQVVARGATRWRLDGP
jgi:uncharacterized protein YhaN